MWVGLIGRFVTGSLVESDLPPQGHFTEAEGWYIAIGSSVLSMVEQEEER